MRESTFQRVRDGWVDAKSCPVTKSNFIANLSLTRYDHRHGHRDAQTRTRSFKTADISQDQRPLWLFSRSIATGAPGFPRSRRDRWLITCCKKQRQQPRRGEKGV